MTEKWTYLRMGCPKVNCSKSVDYLLHSRCGNKNKMEISNKARIRCERCEGISNLTNFYSSCSCSQHSERYLSTEETIPNSFKKALKIAYKSRTMEENVIRELLQYLGEWTGEGTCKAFSCLNDTNYSWEDYCSFHSQCLSKFRGKQNISTSDIKKLETFETWFSELCGYVISAKGSNYVVHFAFFEPKCRSMEEKLTIYNRTGEIYYLSDAENKANEITGKLVGNNPILAFYDDSYHSIKNYILASPEVIKDPLPSSNLDFHAPFVIRIGFHWYPSNPDSYLKPLDVVKVKKTERIGDSIFSWTAMIDYYHVGIYLGNSKVFHLWHPTTVSKMDAQIGSWEDFLSNATGDLIRYHTPIPFKHYEKVIEHIAKADWADLWYGKYDLYNRNCEHLVNVCKYGINWSEQIEDAKVTSWWMKSRGGLKRWFNGESFLNENLVNNGKSSSIILKNEIERSTERIETVLRDKTSAERQDTRNNLEFKYSIEIPSKSGCRIM